MSIRKTFIILIVLVLLVQLAASCSKNSSESPALSDTAITALRDQYPVNELAGKQLQLSYLVKNTSSYVVAEIIGREADTFIIGEVDEYATKVSPPHWIDHANFAIKILVTVVTSSFVAGQPIVEGSQVTKGQELVVSFNLRFPIPKLEAGMVVAMLIAAPIDIGFHPRGHSSSVQGLYYVVDDYVISGFDESEDVQFSGQTLDNFKDEIVRLQES